MDIFTALEGELNELVTQAMLCQSDEQKETLIQQLRELSSNAENHQLKPIVADANAVKGILDSDRPDWSLLPEKTPKGGAL